MVPASQEMCRGSPVFSHDVPQVPGAQIGIIGTAVTVCANTIMTKTATDVVNFMVSGIVWVEY